MSLIPGYGITSTEAIDQVHLTGSGTMDRLEVELQSGKHLTFTRGQNPRQGLRGSVILGTGQSIEVEYLVQRVQQYFELMRIGLKYQPPHRKPYGSGNFGNGNV
jgi:hypothetical protein